MMAFEVGERVVAESESTDRRPRSGVVEEILRGDPSPRYRIRWDDGHESIYTPASRGWPAGASRARSAVRGGDAVRSGGRHKLLDRVTQGAQQHLEVPHGVTVGDHAEEHVAVIAQRGNADGMLGGERNKRMDLAQ